MFEVNGKMYELKYNIKTLEKLEATTGKGVMANLSQSGGILSITDLKIYFALALFNEDGNRVGQKQGLDIAEELIMSEGYAKINEAVVVTLDRDCPFLFQAN